MDKILYITVCFLTNEYIHYSSLIYWIFHNIFLNARMNDPVYNNKGLKKKKKIQCKGLYCIKITIQGLPATV